MFKLANDVLYISWITLQSPPFNRLGLSRLWGLLIKSFSLERSAEVFAMSCRRILASSHDLDAILFINVHVLAVPWVPEFNIKT